MANTPNNIKEISPEASLEALPRPKIGCVQHDCAQCKAMLRALRMHQVARIYELDGAPLTSQDRRMRADKMTDRVLAKLDAG